MMLPTCAGCGGAEPRSEIFYRTLNGNGRWWHRECFHRVLKRQLDLLQLHPIKEHRRWLKSKYQLSLGRIPSGWPNLFSSN